MTSREQYRDSRNLRARIRLHRQYSTNPTGWQPWVFAQLVIPPGGRVLELGCGVGDLWLDNIERMPRCHLVLSDLSAGMVGESRSRLLGSRGSLRFLVADAQAIPFRDACFDVVVANHMLYLVPSLPLALGEIRRVLAPGGRLYASTVARNDLHELRRTVAMFDKDSAVALEAPEAFCLETAPIALRTWFPVITVHRYDDGLVVTEAQPLIDYVLSSSTTTAKLRTRVAELRDYLEAEIDARGAIRITKEAGVVEARAPE